MNPSVQKCRSFFFRAHNDESGAVALLCLAAVLALMMLSWVVFDAHKSTSDKIMLQGAADTAVFSHAAVEARSMNMIAYANIAKRSIVAIHSLYPAMFFSYSIWLASHMGRCFKIWPNPSSCIKFFNNVYDPWFREFTGDHIKYSGNPITPYIDAGLQALRDIASWLGIDTDSSSMSSGNSKKAYARDMKALDNYQHYMKHITPWWAWSEQLSRGWRNGATTVASFPPPPGRITVGLSAVQQAINKLNEILAMLDMQTIDLNSYHGNDNLPTKKPGSYTVDDWAGQLIPFTSNFHSEFVAEHLVNTIIHTTRSSKGARSAMVIAGGATVFFAAVGIPYSEAVFGKTAFPYEVDSGGNEGEWLKRSSNLAFAYLNNPDRMDGDRSKFDVPPNEYTHPGGMLDDLLYGASGYWTMAKSEITFDGSKPDLWHPSWTARMRPVHLPGEFEAGGYSMLQAYSQAVPYLALSAQLGSIQGGDSLNAILNSVRDIGVMAASTAAMGPSTAGGIAK